MDEVGVFFIVALVAAAALYLYGFWRAPVAAVPGVAPLCFALIWVGIETDRTGLDYSALESKRHVPFAELVDLGVPPEAVVILVATAVALFGLRRRASRFEGPRYPWVEATVIAVAAVACAVVAYLRLQVEQAALSLGVPSKVIFDRTAAALELAWVIDGLVWGGLLLCGPLLVFGSIWMRDGRGRR